MFGVGGLIAHRNAKRNKNHTVRLVFSGDLSVFVSWWKRIYLLHASEYEGTECSVLL